MECKLYDKDKCPRLCTGFAPSQCTCGLLCFSGVKHPVCDEVMLMCVGCTRAK